MPGRYFASAVELVCDHNTRVAKLGDKLRNYFKPVHDCAPGADHRAHKGLNNLIEGSHRPTRRRENIMGRFKSPRQVQRFLAAHDQMSIIFRPRRYRLSTISYHHARADAFGLWDGHAAEMTARLREITTLAIYVK